jgi:hypothetical protein
MTSAVAVVIAVVVVAGGIGVLLRSRRSAPDPALLSLTAWQALEPAERVRLLVEWLAKLEPEAEERPAGLIMLGCAWLDRGYPERAVRPFQMAYHTDPDYPVAMVLAFACMKVNCTTADGVLEQVAGTWHEVRRPALGRTRRERAFLTASRRGKAPVGASPLAEALWSLPTEFLRRQIADALTNRPAWARCLLDK